MRSRSKRNYVLTFTALFFSLVHFAQAVSVQYGYESSTAQERATDQTFMYYGIVVMIVAFVLLLINFRIQLKNKDKPKLLSGDWGIAKFLSYYGVAELFILAYLSYFDPASFYPDLVIGLLLYTLVIYALGKFMARLLKVDFLFYCPVLLALAAATLVQLNR
jgi:hypothetical protein